jgi:hypothetical protein
MHSYLCCGAPRQPGACIPGACGCFNVQVLAAVCCGLARLTLCVLCAQVYFEELPPGEERTLEYKFQLAQQVRPLNLFM